MDFLLWPGTSVSELIKDEMHLILRQTVEVSLDEDTPESSLRLIGGDAFLIVYVKERRFFISYRRCRFNAKQLDTFLPVTEYLEMIADATCSVSAPRVLLCIGTGSSAGANLASRYHCAFQEVEADLKGVESAVTSLCRQVLSERERVAQVQTASDAILPTATPEAPFQGAPSALEPIGNFVRFFRKDVSSSCTGRTCKAK